LTELAFYGLGEPFFREKLYALVELLTASVHSFLISIVPKNTFIKRAGVNFWAAHLIFHIF